MPSPKVLTEQLTPELEIEPDYPNRVPCYPAGKNVLNGGHTNAPYSSTARTRLVRSLTGELVPARQAALGKTQLTPGQVTLTAEQAAVRVGGHAGIVRYGTK